MTGRSRSGTEVRENVNRLLIALGLAPLMVGAVFVVIGPAVELTGPVVWILEAVAVVASLVGLLGSARWRAAILDRPMTSGRYLSGTVMLAAIAESGLLLAMLVFLLSGRIISLVVTAVLYILALLALASTVHRVEFEE
jgi:hypothetical protein